jgi:hypothetical protein
MACCYYRTYEGRACWGGLRTGVTYCQDSTHGYLVAPEKGKHKAERLAICAEHWMMRKGDLRAPYTFEPVRA